ncbi:hypothetical protein GCM10010912_67560 [Paenibacillus albidus]|uniref:Uncharacterized protein n=1 Tax=Paenibacillus albidus TaxID=2041023 RepID=A0A917FY42_9BACL|nr:hypothetical protein [Paenibacillus albidus]GGG13647.1 hypothetical protein GCM10010912_67560 [Paenibacillus albidus]
MSSSSRSFKKRSQPAGKPGQPYPAGSIRLNVFSLMLLPDLFLTLPVAANPYNPLYLYLLAPPLVLLNLWALALIAAPGRLQINYVLFRGVYGILCSLGLMTVTQKFAYDILSLPVPWYSVVSFGLYGLAFYAYATRHLAKQGQPAPSWKDKNSKAGTGLSVYIGLGSLVANLSLGIATQQVVAAVLMAVYVMLALLLFHFIMELHRYYRLSRQVQE